MSSSHHKSPSEMEAEYHAQKRFIDEILGESKPLFPQGRLNADDGGELAFAVAVDQSKHVVILRFGKPIDWVCTRLKRDS